MNRAVFTTREVRNIEDTSRAAPWDFWAQPSAPQFPQQEILVTQLLAFLVAMGIKGLRPQNWEAHGTVFSGVVLGASIAGN